MKNFRHYYRKIFIQLQTHPLLLPLHHMEPVVVLLHPDLGTFGVRNPTHEWIPRDLQIASYALLIFCICIFACSMKAADRHFAATLSG